MLHLLVIKALRDPTEKFLKGINFIPLFTKLFIIIFFKVTAKSY